MPVRSLITFDVKSGQNAEFERVYVEGEIMERARAVPGFQGGDLICLDPEAGRYAATALWDSAESYARWQEIGWKKIPEEWRTALLSVLTTLEPGLAGEVAHEVTR